MQKIIIRTNDGQKPISPYIYGINGDYEEFVVTTSKRQGGNRWTAYNWVTNMSSAGNDYYHNNDYYLVSHLPREQWDIPGAPTIDFQEKCLQNGQELAVVTLQMAGYVSADANGPVSEEEHAPSSRFVRTQLRKGAPFTLHPDPHADTVYIDEYVHYLVEHFGKANTARGIKGYSLDNEPAIWKGTHARIQTEPLAAEELIRRSIELAGAVKDIDPYAQIFGPALYGIVAYIRLQDAPDWDRIKEENGYRWFLDYYLDKMAQAERAQGRRLMDVLDIHYYAAATGITPEGERCQRAVTSCRNMEHTGCQHARLQSTRTLYEEGYDENSWVTDSQRSYLPVLPLVRESIQKYYPGTKLALTEYNFGGEGHVSGGIAEADALGIFAEFDVYAAMLWPFAKQIDYQAAGINLYTNYDGKRSRFGDRLVSCQASDRNTVAAYASIEGENTQCLHVILLNKNEENQEQVVLDIHSETAYRTVQAFGFDSSSPEIRPMEDIVRQGEFKDGQWTCNIPRLTALHLVFRP